MIDQQALIEGISFLFSAVTSVSGYFIRQWRKEMTEHRRSAAAQNAVLTKQINQLQQDIDATNERLSQHKLYAAENFVLKRDMEKIADAIFSRFDRLDSKLDRKADKS